jgi:REP element-mobilizing transposase RayT
VLDNHLHLLLRLDPDVANGWSDEEVVRRWGRLFPPRDKSRQPMPVTNDWVQWRLKDVRWVATARERLQSLSWFMKCLKEPLSRLANRQDQTRGTFFEGRFKSVAILDEESLLATCAYIDLNPVAAGIVQVPDRLNSSAESWWARLEKLSRGRLLGRFFAASRDRLRQLAARLGVHHLANLGGCPAR